MQLFNIFVFVILLYFLVLGGWFCILCKNLDLLREELVKECLEEGTKLVQAIADRLFNLPSTEDVDGPIVTLPPPTTKLPRSKHVSYPFYSLYRPIVVLYLLQFGLATDTSLFYN